MKTKHLLQASYFWQSLAAQWGSGAVHWSLVPPGHVTTVVKADAQNKNSSDENSGHKWSLAVTRAEPTPSQPCASDRIWKQSLPLLRLSFLLAALLTALVSLCFLHQPTVTACCTTATQAQQRAQAYPCVSHGPASTARRVGRLNTGRSLKATAQTPPSQAVLPGLVQGGRKHGLSHRPSPKMQP